MTPRPLVAVASAAAVLLTACGSVSGRPEAEGPRPGSTTSPTPPSGSGPGAPRSEDPTTRSRSNARTFARATRALEAAGAVRIGELEPAHGSRASVMGATWRGSEVVAGVVPASEAPDAGPGRGTCVCGTAVVVRDRPLGGSTFRLGPDVWFVSVGEIGARPDRRATASLAAALLCD